MRNLNEELSKLIEFANQNDLIRGLVLQGSFVNDNAPIDIFSDLDPLFYVTDVRSFVDDLSWKKHFGEVMIEWGDEWEIKDGKKGYTRLTLYKDGFKLDFGFQHISLAKYANDMPLYKVYVDKDNLIPQPKVTDESNFYVQKPSNKEYQNILLDFYFDTSYVVKSIYRKEEFFSQHMFHILHTKLYDMIRWYIGTKYDFKVNTGSMGRYFKRYLTLEEQEALHRTYLYDSVKNKLEALFTMFDMIEDMGKQVANYMGYDFPSILAKDMRKYCIKVQTLIENSFKG